MVSKPRCPECGTPPFDILDSRRSRYGEIEEKCYCSNCDGIFLAFYDKILLRVEGVDDE